MPTQSFPAQHGSHYRRVARRVPVVLTCPAGVWDRLSPLAQRWLWSVVVGRAVELGVIDPDDVAYRIGAVIAPAEERIARGLNGGS